MRTDFAVRGGSALERQALSQDLTLYQPFVRDCLACLQEQRTRQGQEGCVLRAGGKTGGMSGRTSGTKPCEPSARVALAPGTKRRVSMRLAQPTPRALHMRRLTFAAAAA